MHARRRPVRLGGVDRTAQTREGSGTGKHGNHQSAGLQRLPQVYQRAGQVIHRVQQAEHADELKASERKGPLHVDRMLAYDVRGLLAACIPQYAVCHLIGVIADDQRAFRLVTQKCKALLHVLHHIVQHEARRIGQAALKREHAAAAGTAAAGGEDAGGRTGHPACLPILAQAA